MRVLRGRHDPDDRRLRHPGVREPYARVHAPGLVAQMTTPFCRRCERAVAPGQGAWVKDSDWPEAADRRVRVCGPCAERLIQEARAGGAVIHEWYEADEARWTSPDSL